MSVLADLYQNCFYYVIAWAAFVGLVIGSFLNVLIIRLPMIEGLVDNDLDGDEKKLPLTLMGRSHCPHCGTEIPWRHNIPLLSWLLLRGRGACCQKPIHWRYPVVELITSLATVGMVMSFGLTEMALFGVVLSSLFISLVIIDIDHMMLPDKLTGMVLWSVLVASVMGVHGEPSQAIIGACVGYGFLSFIALVFKVLYKKDGIGGGDAKLLAGIGALVGALAVPGVMMGAVATFAFYAVAMGRFDKDARYPFGPFIVLGYVMWVIFGPYYIY